MREKIINLLRQHQANIRDDGPSYQCLQEEVDDIIDLVNNLPSDDEIDRLRKAEAELSWLKYPDKMGQL